MKRLSTILATVIVALAFALPSSAQISFGPKVGICVNELHFNKDVLNTANRTGFTGGVMIDGHMPLLGFAFDASLMYVRREAGKNFHSDYVAIPVNLKYRFSFPVVNRIVVPFLSTGPEWAYLVHHTKVDGLDDNKSNFSWNFGLGVELFKHLQLAGNYGLGLSKAYETPDGADGKNRFWTVTAAWLF